MPSVTKTALTTTTGALLAALTATALASGAGHDAVTAASKCKLGKEAQGCKFKSTAYYNAKSGIVFQAQQPASSKDPRSLLLVPGSYICGKAKTEAQGAGANGGSKKFGKIGGSISLKTTTNPSNPGTVAKTSVSATVELLSAKKATVSGTAKITFSDGSTCKKTLSGTLKRVLGG